MVKTRPNGKKYNVLLFTIRKINLSLHIVVVNARP